MNQRTATAPAPAPDTAADQLLADDQAVTDDAAADLGATEATAPEGTPGVPIAEAQPAGRADFTEVWVKNGPCAIGHQVLLNGHRRGHVVDFVEDPNRAGEWLVRIEWDHGGLFDARAQAVSVLLDEPRVPPGSTREAAEAKAQNLYPFPTDASFGDADVQDAGDLYQIARMWIETTDDFPHLKSLTAKILCLWDRKGGSSGGVPKLAAIRKANKVERHKAGAVLVLSVAADVARDLRLKREQMEAVVHERLCVADKDEHGNLRLAGPDFLGYRRNVHRCGDLVPRVRVATEVLSEASEDIRNLRMDLDGDQDDDADDEDDGDEYMGDGPDAEPEDHPERGATV